jgi:hypothetical protein
MVKMFGFLQTFGKEHQFCRDKYLPRLEVDDVNTFKRFGSYAGLDLSTTTDIPHFRLISEPDDDEFATSNRFFLS